MLLPASLMKMLNKTQSGKNACCNNETLHTPSPRCPFDTSLPAYGHGQITCLLTALNSASNVFSRGPQACMNGCSHQSKQCPRPSAAGGGGGVLNGRVKPKVLTPVPATLTEAWRTPMIMNDSRTLPYVKWHFCLFQSKNKNSHLVFVNTI